MKVVVSRVRVMIAMIVSILFGVAVGRYIVTVLAIFISSQSRIIPIAIFVAINIMNVSITDTGYEMRRSWSFPHANAKQEARGKKAYGKRSLVSRLARRSTVATERGVVESIIGIVAFLYRLVSGRLLSSELYHARPLVGNSFQLYFSGTQIFDTSSCSEEIRITARKIKSNPNWGLKGHISKQNMPRSKCQSFRK